MKIWYKHLGRPDLEYNIVPPRGYKFMAIVPSGDTGVNIVYVKK